MNVVTTRSHSRLTAAAVLVLGLATAGPALADPGNGKGNPDPGGQGNGHGNSSATATNNHPETWQTLPGEQCYKVDVGSESGAYTMPAEPEDRDWSKLIIKKGAGNIGVENQVFTDPVAGQTYTWQGFDDRQDGGWSHVILCSVAGAPATTVEPTPVPGTPVAPGTPVTPAPTPQTPDPTPDAPVPTPDAPVAAPVEAAPQVLGEETAEATSSIDTTSAQATAAEIAENNTIVMGAQATKAPVERESVQPPSAIDAGADAIGMETPADGSLLGLLLMLLGAAVGGVMWTRRVRA